MAFCIISPSLTMALASFYLLIATAAAFMAIISALPTFSSALSREKSSLPTSPASLLNPPLLSPFFEELPPDVAPLLPSPAVSSSSGNSAVPTIQANPATDPNQPVALGPAYPISPEILPLPMSSARASTLLQCSKLATFIGMMSCALTLFRVAFLKNLVQRFDLY